MSGNFCDKKNCIQQMVLKNRTIGTYSIENRGVQTNFLLIAYVRFENALNF